MLLSDKKVVVLDEATSALNTETEAYVKEILQTRLIGKTVFVVAHRLSTIQGADRIFVVEDGELTEQGKHHELLRSRGRYSVLWAAQTRSDRQNARDRISECSQ